MRRSLLVDALFALTMTIAVMAGSLPAGREQPEMRALDGLAWAILAVAGLILTFRRLWPFFSVAVTFTLTMTYVYFDFPYGPIFLYTMVAVYSAAAWRSLGYAFAVGALTIGSHLPWSWWVEKEPDGLPFSLFTGAVWLVSPIAVGIAVRARRVADARSHAEERMRHVSEERLRMAQEVHDTVGHSLAVISMNAGAALHVLSKAPSAQPQLGDSLRAIRSASGSALDELRAVLASRTTAGLASLPSLVAATRVDGLTVTLTTSGDPPPLPSNLDLAAYRIAQEALANIVRHSRATHATVAVTYLPSAVDLRITDNGPAHPSPAGLHPAAPSPAAHPYPVPTLAAPTVCSPAAGLGPAIAHPATSSTPARPTASAQSLHTANTTAPTPPDPAAAATATPARPPAGTTTSARPAAATVSQAELHPAAAAATATAARPPTATTSAVPNPASDFHAEPDHPAAPSSAVPTPIAASTSARPRAGTTTSARPAAATAAQAEFDPAAPDHTAALSDSPANPALPTNADHANAHPPDAASPAHPSHTAATAIPAPPAGQPVVPTGHPSALRAVEPHIRAGSGIPSMHNRARQLGGSLTAGWLPSGGFEVRATLPYSSGDL